MFDIETIRTTEQKCRVDLTTHIRLLMKEPKSQTAFLYASSQDDISLIRETIKTFSTPTALELKEQLENMIEKMIDSGEAASINFEFNDIDQEDQNPEFIFWCDNLAGIRFTELSMEESLLMYEIFSTLKNEIKKENKKSENTFTLILKDKNIEITGIPTSFVNDKNEDFETTFNFIKGDPNLPLLKKYAVGGSVVPFCKMKFNETSFDIVAMGAIDDSEVEISMYGMKG